MKDSYNQLGCKLSDITNCLKVAYWQGKYCSVFSKPSTNTAIVSYVSQLGWWYQLCWLIICLLFPCISLYSIKSINKKGQNIVELKLSCYMLFKTDYMFKVNS